MQYCCKVLFLYNSTLVWVGIPRVQFSVCKTESLFWEFDYCLSVGLSAYLIFGNLYWYVPMIDIIGRYR